MSMSSTEFCADICEVLLAYQDASELDIKLVSSVKRVVQQVSGEPQYNENVVLYQVLRSDDFDDTNYQRMWKDMMYNFHDSERSVDRRQIFLSCLLLTYWPEVFDRIMSISGFTYVPNSDREEIRKMELDYTSENKLWPELVNSVSIPVLNLNSSNGGQLLAEHNLLAEWYLNMVEGKPCWPAGCESIRRGSQTIKIGPADNINTDTNGFKAVFGICSNKPCSTATYTVGVTMESGNKYLVAKASTPGFDVYVKKTDDFDTGASFAPSSTLSAVYNISSYTDRTGNKRRAKLAAIHLGNDFAIL